MFWLHLARHRFAQLAAAALVAAQLPGWIPSARGADAPPPAPGTAIHHSLRELDRFLDHHPLIEDELRLDPSLIGNATFLEQHEELRDFIGANPGVIQELSRHPRFFLYRALLQQASEPLRFFDIAQLGEVLDGQPALERALAQKPELIRDPAFLREHALLGDFLERHPVLGRAFLPHRMPPATKT